MTADTITDDQIRQLRAATRPPKPLTRRDLWNLCDRALRNQGAWDQACRVRCAQMFNQWTSAKNP